MGRSPLQALEPGVVVGGLLPAAVLAYDAWAGFLGAEPFKQAIHQTGQLAIILLTLSLACTPLRKLTGWTWPVRVRRGLGLLAFAYATFHLGLYLWSQDWSLGLVVEDILKRPFITSGVLALLLLLPLALTSRRRSVGRLGFARWTRLHQLVYPAAALAALHYWWGVKRDHTGPLTVILVLLALGLARAIPARGRREKRRS